MARREYSKWDPDLVAYADRQLDPERAAEVARYIAENPEAQRCVREIAHQNAALREAFDGQLDEPLPERLRDLVYGRPANQSLPLWQRRWSKACAAVSAVALAGWVGWWIGQEDQPAYLQAFLDEAALTYATRTGASFAPESVLASADGGLDAQALPGLVDNRQPLHWLSERISLELDAPDLSHLDLRLIDKRRVEVQGQRGVELVYQRPDSSQVSLFLKTRWAEEGGEVRLTEAQGQTLAYWLDGPLVYAVASPGQGQETGQLAQDIQAALAARNGNRQPALEPAPLPRPNNNEAGLIAPVMEPEPLSPLGIGGDQNGVQSISDRQTM